MFLPTLVVYPAKKKKNLSHRKEAILVVGVWGGRKNNNSLAHDKQNQIS